MMLSAAPVIVRSSLPALAWVAKRIAGSWLLPWRVQFFVRRRTKISFPGRIFRTWLKRAARDELRFPLDQVGAELANSLDRELGASFRWAVQLDRRSKALNVVEAVYDAAIQLSPAAEARSLGSSWDAKRHDELLRRLTQLAGSFSGLAREDEASVLRMYSASRRSVRVSAFGIDVGLLSETLEAEPVVAVPLGEIRVLVGAFGSGKSEAAERWHAERVEAFAKSPAAPHAVWLDAANLAHRSVEEALESLLTADGWREAGVAAVIDGLDEIDSARASHLLSQSRVLVRAIPNSAVLLTSRPGALALGEDALHWPGLGPDEAVRLVETIAGARHSTWTWGNSLRDAITRPFFALAAGVMIANGQRPAGEADLIRRLVEYALADAPTNAAAVTSTPRYLALKALAENLTRSGNADDGLSFQERALVLQTTLVHERHDGVAEFTLPILQQWFAAQSILEAPNKARALAADPQRFDRWRWAIAVACVAGNSAAVDAIITESLKGNPGAGSWVIKQVSSGHDWHSGEPIDGPTAGPRLLHATRTMVDAMGALAPFFFPVRSQQQPIVLGVRTQEAHMVTAWSVEPSATDAVVELPEDVHPLNRSGEQEWIGGRSGPVPEGTEWPWRIAQERISRGFADMLTSRPQLGPRFGIWHVESMYRAARVLVRDENLLFSPLRVNEVVRAIRDLESRVGDLTTSRFDFSGKEVSGEIIADLLVWLDGAGGETLARPLPSPDVDPASSGGWVWGLYSDHQLQRFHAEAFGAACEAYDEAVASYFSEFDWTMRTGADGPFGVVGELSFDDDGFAGIHRPGYAATTVPLDVVRSLAARFGDAAVLAANGRALFTVQATNTDSDWVRAIVDEQLSVSASTAPFSARGRYTVSVGLDTAAARPSTEIAANWLFDDCSALGLADGVGPRFAR